MESRATRRFWRLFADLPVEVQQEAKRAYRILPGQSAPPRSAL